jgi:hypothetical protein
MNITGHGKGYAYNMGSEANIAVMFGIILLILWIVSLFPVIIWLSMRLYKVKKYLFFIPILAFILIFIISISMSGWGEFIAFFGIGFSKFTR